MSGNKTLSSVLIPLQQRPLLLPTACVVEVLDFTRPVDHHPDINWLLGDIRWRGHSIPVISFELLNQRQFALFSATNRIVVIRRTTEDCHIPFYGMVVQGLPQPLELTQKDIAPSVDRAGPAEKMQVLFKEVPAALPDLALIEDKLDETLKHSTATN